MLAPDICATIPRKVTFLGAREIPPLNLDLLALTFLSFDYALRSALGHERSGRMELRVEDSGQVLLTLDGDSGQVLLTLDGYPTSPADCAHGQRCSPKTQETPVAPTVNPYFL